MSGVALRRFAPRLWAATARHQPCRAFSSKMQMIKQLREMTGAPMKDCNEALAKSAGEDDVIDAAFNWLRLAGKNQMAKKSGRAANEGLVALQLSAENTKGVVVELNSETDFVANNAIFHKLLVDMVDVASTLDAPCPTSLAAAPSQAISGTVGDHVADAVTGLRENIKIGRVISLTADAGGVLSGYVHQRTMVEGLNDATKIGRIGCLVGVNGESVEDAKTLGEKVAMHVAAAKPAYLSQADIPEEVAAAEKAILMEQATASGKPANVAEKMVMGRMNKFFEEHCLLDQKFLVHDGAGSPPKVSKVATEQGAAVTAFARLQIGDVAEDATSEE